MFEDGLCLYMSSRAAFFNPWFLLYVGGQRIGGISASLYKHIAVNCSSVSISIYVRIQPNTTSWKVGSVWGSHSLTHLASLGARIGRDSLGFIWAQSNLLDSPVLNWTDLDSCGFTRTLFKYIQTAWYNLVSCVLAWFCSEEPETCACMFGVAA
jgi:hypothetical protein